MSRANTPLSSTLNLPRDKNNNALQSVTLTTSTVVVSISGSSAGGAVPTDAEVVRCASTGNCHFAWGFGSQPTASTTDPIFPTGAEVFNVPDGATHFAVIQAGASTGSFSLTAVE